MNKNKRLGSYCKVILRFATLGLLVLALPVQAADPDLWVRVQAGLSLDQHEHRRIDAQRRWYENHPEYLRRVSRRAVPYLHYVVGEVEKRGMPMELALLPVMESAYDPFAYSHGRAAGLWQIIPGTAGDLGLAQNWWYDGRRDVRASTDAALEYLAQLNRAFDGDWLQTLAAYNAGKRRVLNAIAANRVRGLGTDFWSLKLPGETRSYVPRLLALSQVIARPASYGAELTPVPDKPYFSVAQTGSQIDLSQAADLAGVDLEDLYLLNPGFSRWATAPEGPHELLLPVSRLANFEVGLADLDPAQRLEWVRYRIQPGDAISVIAGKFSTTAAVIREVNGLRDNRIRAGDALLIPTAGQALDSYALSAGRGAVNGQPGGRGSRETLQRKLGYRVRSGDSLARIAGKFNITVDDIIDWNGSLQGKKYIHPGQVLTLYVDITGG